MQFVSILCGFHNLLYIITGYQVLHRSCGIFFFFFFGWRHSVDVKSSVSSFFSMLNELFELDTSSSTSPLLSYWLWIFWPPLEFICLLFGRTRSFSLNNNSMHLLFEKNESLVWIKGSVKSWSLLSNLVHHSKNIKCLFNNTPNIKAIIRLYSYYFWYWSYA